MTLRSYAAYLARHTGAVVATVFLVLGGATVPPGPPAPLPTIPPIEALTFSAAPASGSGDAATTSLSLLVTIANGHDDAFDTGAVQVAMSTEPLATGDDIDQWITDGGTENNLAHDRSNRRHTGRRQ